MWIEQRNGKYRAHERYVDPITGLRHTVSVTLDRDTPRSRKAAQAALEGKISTALESAGEYDDMTLSELMRLYLTRSGIRESTRLRDTALSHVLLDIFDGRTMVNRLNAGYVKRKLAAKDKEDNRELIARYKALMRWAYKNDYVANISYLDKIEKPRKRVGEINEKYLEENELRDLLAGMKVDAWRDLTEFLVRSGLRIGEAMDLNHSDIGADVIHVNSTMGLLTEQSGPTKTDAGTRDVTITPRLRKCIARIRARSMTSFKFLTTPQGKPIDKNGYAAYRKYLAENSEKIVGRRITPHALRHTYTSLMAGAGVPLDVISRQLGHEDSALTRQVYFHRTEKLKERDAAIIKKAKML